MKKLLNLSVTLITISLLSSCAYLENLFPKKQVAELDSLESAPKIDIKKFFNGDVEGFAITQDSTGKIIGTVQVKIYGKWDENKGEIKQNFIYDGTIKDSRIWLITINADGTFDAIGHDIAAPAQGKQIGNAAQMLYTLNLMDQGVKQPVRFEDKMYLVDEKSMIEISSYNKANGISGKTITSLKKTGN
ncbi:MAG: DUF3833 family protein [Pseudomonadota bacterium]